MRFFVYVTLIAALLFSFMPTQAMLAATVVEPANPNGWVVVDDNGKGAGMGDFVSGPATAPLGIGSAHLVLSSSDAGWIFSSKVNPGTKIAELSTLKYSTYVTTSPSVQAVAMSITVDYDVTDENTAYQGRLVYEPYFNGTVNKGEWQEWNANLPESKWYATGLPGKTTCPMSAPCNLSKILTDFPNIGFINNPLHRTINFKAGSGWASFDGNFDKLVVGVNGVDQTFDFEPSAEEAASTVYVDDDFVIVYDNQGTEIILPLPLYADPDGDGPAKSMGYDASVTVQGGVDLVAPAGTVKIAAGTYTEQVIVRDLDGITIEGAGEDVVTITAIPNMVSILDADRKPVLGVVSSENVTVKNLTLDGAGTGNTNNRLFGLFYHNSSGLIDHVTAKAMRHTPLNGIQGGVGIYVYNTDNVERTVTATNNTAIDYQKGGLVFNGVGLTAIVDKNTATGMGATPLIAMNGIQIGFGASGTVTRNTVSGHDYTGTANATSAGILVYEASANVTSNVINNNQVGVSSYKSTFTASRNYISGGKEIGEYGIAQDGGTSTITANNITSNDNGIEVSTDEKSITPYTAASTIRNNRFFNNDIGVANRIFVFPNQEATELDALNNWWSCNEGPKVIPGDCDTTLGLVDTTTWLMLSLTSDITHVFDGKPATLTASITKNNLGEVVSDPVQFPDGKSVAFTAPGMDTPVEKDLKDGSAAWVFSVTKDSEFGTTPVSVKLDDETVTLNLLTGLMKIRLPFILK